MMNDKEFQSSNIPQINGTEDDDSHEHDDETTTSNTSSGPQVRRSRFFRSKRKQRLHEEQPYQPESDNNDVSHESVNSSESPEQPIENRSFKEISTTDTTDITDTDIQIKKTIARRLLSSPPPPFTDDPDEQDKSSILDENQFSLPIEDFNAERQTYLIKKSTHENKSSASVRPSLPTIYSGYQRKKSQSVKLTRIGPIDVCSKKVRFADDFGLDLSQIKMIKSDELPDVPSTAFKDLHISNDNDSLSSYQEHMKTITYLEQHFDNPIHAHGFEDRVSRHKVVLEQANAIDNRIYGTVKIVSFGLNKRVKIRLTTDNWVSYNDYDATYIMDSFDGIHDRFSFTLEIDRNRICVGNNIQFCIGYESYVGPEYWDSNYQQNYRFGCISRSIPDYSY